MRNRFFEKKNRGRRSVSIVLCILLVATSFVATIGISESNDVEILAFSFSFLEPDLQTMEADGSEYALIDMPGCMAVGKRAGGPMMPVKIIKLLIPPMKTVTNVEVIGTSANVDLDGFDLIDKPVFPYQNPVIFGEAPGEFIIDNSIYISEDLYPGVLQDDYSIGYSHGYAILDVALNPLQYSPKSGELVYYSEMTVNIELEESTYVNEFFRNNPDDKFWVEKLVYNPDIADMYTSDIPTFGYPGGLCDPSDDYDYVIITTTHNNLDDWDTTSSIPYNWDSLMDKHESDDGLSCTLVTIQDIDACTDYHGTPPFNDQEAHIREFCKDAYDDWGTEYVLIGGDDEWIPAREMETSYESNIDSDLYWSNLDNNFNADGDNYWGEAGDGGFDLYSELFIGRITCDIPQDVSNWMTKSFYYADNFDADYIDNAAFYGGDTGWACQGDDFEDFSAIKGTDDWLGPDPHYDGPWPTWLGFLFGFETWNSVNVGNEFDLTCKWTAEPPNPGGWQGGSESAAINGLKNDISNDQVTLLSGIAHANSGMSLDVYSSSWESDYHNTKPFFIHDYGCHCGDMDASDDGVLHSMLFHSDTELAFACVYNTCYGWGNLYCTNSSSALQQKLFWDYLLDVENNSGDYGNWQLGKAQAWSKDMMAPTINWDPSYGTWRAIIQGCLLFGDPAQCIKTKNPSDPPNKPTKPTGPPKGIIYYDITFSSSTTDPNNDQILYKFDWGDGTDSGWLGPYNSGTTAYATYAWTELGDYEVKVRARDVNGAGSPWSDPLTISIVDNLPPGLPTISGPPEGQAGITYLYTIMSIDPDDHDVCFYVDWGDDTITDWTTPYDSGDQAGLSHTWAEDGTYTVRVKARDIFDDESDWATLTVSMPRNRAINTPLLKFFDLFPNAFPLLRYILGL